MPDDTIYVAFRGTDGSIVGWKEDLLFSYEDKTAGQKGAVSYVKRYFRNSSQHLHLGGHSKGCNLAMYEGMHLDNTMQDRIVSIFSGDDPEFQIKLVQSEGYQDIKSKMTLVIPYATMIGQLMNHDVTPILVMSDAKGILQHNGFSWQIKHNHFVNAEQQSEQSLFFKQVITLWLDNIDKSKRQVFIDIFFSFYEESGEQNIDVALAKPLQLVLATKHQLFNLSKEQQK